jgi:hypothetical protein
MVPCGYLSALGYPSATTVIASLPVLFPAWKNFAHHSTARLTLD